MSNSQLPTDVQLQLEQKATTIFDRMKEAAENEMDIKYAEGYAEGWHEGATGIAERAQSALVEIEKVHKMYHDLNGDNPAANHILNVAREHLQQWKEGKDVVRPEHNVSIGDHITYCHDCGFPIDECNCIED